MKVEGTERIPIKLWLNDMEESAMAQARNLANLPFAYKHIAIMPDSHCGYGMPIGGVMATEGVVICNAVGVDIGCLDRDTEYLTESGWKKISKYEKGDKVLQYNLDNDEANFVKPLKYIVKKCKEFYHFKNSKGMNQMLSEEHKILMFKGFKSRGYKSTNISPKSLENLGDSLNKNYYNFKAAFNINNKGINLTDDEIRLDVMISADGSIKYSKGNTHQIYLHFRKKRKIKRAKDLLKKIKVKYKETKGIDGSTHIYFFINKKINKDLSRYWKANKSQLKVLMDECLLWDGYKGYRSFFSSTNKTSADIIQFAFTSNNIRAGISINKAKKKNWKDVYVVTPTKNNMVSFTNNINKIKSKDNKKYCFTVPTGYFVTRRENKIFITGNCGMAAVKTPFKELSTDKLKEIMGEIRKQVPVGFKHNTEPNTSKMPKWSMFGDSDYIITQQWKSAEYQLGTLGGGNHFIEIQKGSDEHIWIMIHSGSRNLGLKVANHYNKVAKKLNYKFHSKVPDKWDLAFLPLDHIQAKNYLLEMNYCVDFALENRRTMMDKVINIFIDKMKGEHTFKQHPKKEFDEMINIAHNYAKMEHHFGKNVMVHRKGATLASKGTIGIIPGSQGTASYIVEGLGNSESFNSCSHGAGRKMGRNVAKRTLDLKAEQKKLDDQGIVHSVRGVSDLDEAPGSYKDIDVVMDNQKDLVKILIKLTPLGVVKG